MTDYRIKLGFFCLFLFCKRTYVTSGRSSSCFVNWGHSQFETENYIVLPIFWKHREIQNGSKRGLMENSLFVGSHKGLHRPLRVKLNNRDIQLDSGGFAEAAWLFIIDVEGGKKGWYQRKRSAALSCTDFVRCTVKKGVNEQNLRFLFIQSWCPSSGPWRGMLFILRNKTILTVFFSSTTIFGTSTKVKNHWVRVSN